MIEVFLFRIVLGLISITVTGLFVTAYLQLQSGVTSPKIIVQIKKKKKS